MLLGEQGVDRRRQVGQAVLQLVKFVARRAVVVVVVVVRVLVAARTGRLGLLSAAWFAGMPAAVGQGDDLLGVVGQRFADLLLQGSVVVVEVPEEVPGAGSDHAGTIAPR
jgi:hypothetical protein